MQPAPDFEFFYLDKILPLLGKIKQLRQQMKNWEWGCALALIFTLANFLTCQGNTGNETSGWLAGFGAIIFAFCISRYAYHRDKYLGEFKSTCIKEVLDFLLPGVIYKPDSFIPSKEYRRSGLFRRRYDAFEGEDYIQGVYKDVKFHCSEISASFNKANNVDHSIFEGLFFVASISPVFQSATYLWPSGEEQVSSIAHEHYRYYAIPEVKQIITGNKTFDQYYSVYSSSKDEASYLLGGDLMPLLVKYRRQIKMPVSLSFVTGKCYVAIPLEKSLFEPNKKDPGDKETIKEYFFSGLLILSIINQLHLSRLT
ncbi:MAG: DUF3137 domain-containing protein [Ferruginibacter sp.]